MRLVASLNLKWNMNDQQIRTLVEDLIERYPHESIEDFALLFKKARQGEYGELIRLDSAIVFSWMEYYLDEKYAVKEAELKKQHAAPPPPSDDEGPGYKAFKEWAQSLASQMKQAAGRPFEEGDAQKEGQENKPPQKKAKYHPSTSLEVSKMLDWKSEYGRLHTDLYSKDTLPGHPTFEEFIKTKKQEQRKPKKS